jgi:hypothetical protein
MARVTVINRAEPSPGDVSALLINVMGGGGAAEIAADPAVNL